MERLADHPVQSDLNTVACALYGACLNAVGAYEALEASGAHQHLPCFQSARRDLFVALAQAETIQLDVPSQYMG